MLKYNGMVKWQQWYHLSLPKGQGHGTSVCRHIDASEDGIVISGGGDISSGTNRGAQVAHSLWALGMGQGQYPQSSLRRASEEPRSLDKLFILGVPKELHFKYIHKYN